VFLAGVQLFVLTNRTEHWFAWTIAVPLTAAFLGAFYWTAIPLAALSATRRYWADARVAIPGVFVFLVLTFVTSMLHLGKFHLHDADHVARGAAWLWLVIYAGTRSCSRWRGSSRFERMGPMRVEWRLSPPGIWPGWVCRRRSSWRWAWPCSPPRRPPHA